MKATLNRIVLRCFLDVSNASASNVFNERAFQTEGPELLEAEVRLLEPSKVKNRQTEVFG